jgi:hypothetical protein
MYQLQSQHELMRVVTLANQSKNSLDLVLNTQVEEQ